MMAAIKAAQNEASVTLLEKNPLCGRKLAITGKGRCNITNTKSWQEFSNHIHPKSNFLKSSFWGFSNKDAIAFFEEHGLETVLTQGDRVFPKSMKAFDVVDTFVAVMHKYNVDVRTDCELLTITKAPEGGYTCIYVQTTTSSRLVSCMINSKSVVIATGGLAYPSTGSTGKGYELAQSFGHTITECFPSLTALIPKFYSSDFYDIELKNVGLSLFVDKDLVQTDMGDLTFTEGGIEGSLGYRLSRKAVKALKNGTSVELVLDLKPAIDLETLKNRVKREIEKFDWGSNLVNDARMKKLLRKFMPSELINPFVDSNDNLNSHNLAERLKDWRFPIKDYVGYRRAVVTAGGVDLGEIVSKSMQSKLSPGLFFAGEVLDIDGDTGGYNLQTAYSTGAMAGVSAAKYVHNKL